MNTYLFVFGVRVSGYIQYSGVKLLEGDSVDQAFNAEFLEDCPAGDWVVMEVYKLKTGMDVSSVPYRIEVTDMVRII